MDVFCSKVSGDSFVLAVDKKINFRQKIENSMVTLIK